MREMASSSAQEVEMEVNKDVIIGIAIETWRFRRVFERMLTKLEVGEQQRYKNQLRWFEKKLEEFMAQVGWQIVDVEGQPFDPGMAATPLNIEDFESEDSLMVNQMLEPIIMGRDGLVKTGTVTLKREAS